MNDLMTLSQKADALEEQMARELDYIVVKSRIYQLADGDMGPPLNPAEARKKNPNAKVLMGDDPRLPAMPDKPTLMDFFKYRFGPSIHLLQRAACRKRWSSPACCTTSRPPALSAATMAIGARSWSSLMSTRK